MRPGFACVTRRPRRSTQNWAIFKASTWRGEQAAPRMGALLAAEGLRPDLNDPMLSSLARATAGLVAAACEDAGEICAVTRWRR